MVLEEDIFAQFVNSLSALAQGLMRVISGADVGQAGEGLHVEGLGVQSVVSPTGSVSRGKGKGFSVGHGHGGDSALEAPALEVGEDVAQKGPEGGEVGDVDGDGCFAEVPVQVDICDEAWD